MFDYLQQFNKLPKELREKVSSPAAMDVLSSLEKKYQVNLAMLVMQIMVKQVLVKDLTSHLITEMSLSQEKAESLGRELQEKLFFSVSTYLGLKIEKPLSFEEEELEKLMKDNAIVLPSSDLMNRCRQIILTYCKGVRTKIDTRAALERDVNRGGLGLDMATIDRLLRALDLFLRPQLAETNKPKASSELNNLINQQEAAAYNLKSAIAKGQVKTPLSLVNKFKQNVLDTKHELAAVEDELEIEAPDPVLLLQTEKDNVPEKESVKKSIAQVKPQTEINIKDKLIDSKGVKSEAVGSSEVTPLPVINNEDEKEKAVEFAVNSNAKIKNGQNINFKEKKPLVVSEKINNDNKEKITKTLVNTNIKFDQKNELKNKQLEDLKPVAATSTNFKKSPSELSNLWSKLFKEKASVKLARINKINSLSSNHLEDAVKAAVQESVKTSRPAASSDSRTRIEDIKVKPKVMGPLEELRYLDLVNFRRLGSTPKEITTKIVNKIHLLERDGYDRMIEGVKAWRQSPVNHLYVRLAQEAIASGLNLEEAVAQRQRDKKESLSMEELKAIMAMNNELMF